KNNKITEHMSIPDQRWTVHLTWSPGAYKLPTAPGGSWRKDSPGWEKAEDKLLRRQACVCVCPVSPPYIHVCVLVCCVCVCVCVCFMCVCACVCVCVCFM